MGPGDSTADAPRDPAATLPVVAIGASAGGLDAITQLLRGLPTDTGMAFIVIQHLDPRHPSLLTEILQRATPMPTVEVRDGTKLEPDHVFVIPPNADMTLTDGHLELSPRTEARGQHRPIDRFFATLAQMNSHRAIAVILSGTASDGTLGMTAVKAEGGITFAQDATAAHGSMPRSAIAAGVVDYVLSPTQIAEELTRIARHPHISSAPARRPEEPKKQESFARILKLLYNATHVDFTHYRGTTLYRRITRRMALHRIENMGDYVSFMESHASEVHDLYNDILINVTHFFRDPDVFDYVKRQVLPQLTDERPNQGPIRVWVLGCSTGEEAYSIAILLAEHMEEAGAHMPVQIYATDLSASAIDKARTGLYSRDIARDVSPERLRRFFIDSEGGYRVIKPIRDMCIFASQNVLVDPPFSRMDLVSCRNLLIYLEPVLQKRVVPALHYALRHNGVLWLGSSESVGPFSDLFDVVDAKQKVFLKKAGPVRMQGAFGTGVQRTSDAERSLIAERTTTTGDDLQREADRAIIARYAPVGVVINSEMEILQFRGDTSAYLAPASGRASLNLLKMVREGLLMPLRAALQRAKKEHRPVRDMGLVVKTPAGTVEVGIEVIPLRSSDSQEMSYIVSFETPGDMRIPVPGVREASAEALGLPPQDAERQVVRLTQELTATREYLQSLIEQHEAANEELQSANEEIQSANEELQSINEELETSKEEIQSSNEELNTVNEELQTRIGELDEAREYAETIVATAREPLIVLDGRLRIHTASAAFCEVFFLKKSEIEGQPFLEISGGEWDFPELRALLDDALAHGRSARDIQVEHEFERQGRRTMVFNVEAIHRTSVPGPLVLVAIQDVTERALLETALRMRIEDLASADRSKNEFLAMLAHELRNPLAPISNAAHVLNSSQVAPEVQAQARDMIERQVRNMKRMIDDLLDVSRITRGSVRLRMQQVDLVPLLSRVVQIATDSVRGHSDIDLVTPGGAVVVDGDPTRLEQVFGNLVNNACKFVRDGGHIWITLVTGPGSPDGTQEAVIRVKDDGVGIPPEMLPHVFDLFAQADQSLERQKGGLGIGLTLARQLVELHGGRVEAHSDGIDRGAEFVVRIPILRPDQIVSQTAVTKDGVERAEVPLRILVVEDNRDGANSLEMVLTLYGHDVRIARDGPSAISIVEAFHPDVVLLDIGLPGMSGYEVARRIKQLPATQAATLIALTGYGQEEDRRRAHEAGFEHHLTKPVPPAELRRLLASLTRARH